jgi:hypothetical protein
LRLHFKTFRDFICFLWGVSPPLGCIE